MYTIPLKTFLLFAALHIALFVVTVTLIARQTIRRTARRFSAVNR